RGIPSKRESSARVDYVPALCTHRPSLLPIEWLSETSGLALGSRQRHPIAEKLVKLGHLEENSVNHRIFERTLRPLVFRRARLFECREILNPRDPCGAVPGVIIVYAVGYATIVGDLLPTVERQLYRNLTSNQAGLPAELKHINKRRKRN
ncbi:hypothetical protein HETIRDRAFT_55694, partial [Heterobasidion irregulare TC 32-1]